MLVSKIFRQKMLFKFTFEIYRINKLNIIFFNIFLKHEVHCCVFYLQLFWFLIYAIRRII